MPKSSDERFDRLETLIERGFAAVAEDAAEMKGQIATLQSDMGAVKVGIAALQYDTREVKSDIKEIRAELKDIRYRLEALESTMQNTTGFAKEIDYLLQRVNAIEKHLGMERKIAA